MERIPVIIDCDPGADDLLAILLAFASPELEVLGITTAFGNSTVDKTTINATRACVLAGTKMVKVYKGAASPMTGQAILDTSYCGKDGLCDSTLPGDTHLVSSRTAADFIVDTLNCSAQPVTIVSTAAMTNIALALCKAPSVWKSIKEITTISGYYGLNASVARAEWNILLDPTAAKVVYDSGAPIRAAGVDVRGVLQESYLDELLLSGCGAVYDFLNHTTSYNRAHLVDVYSVLIDAMAVAQLLLPDLATYACGVATVHPHHKDETLIRFRPCADADCTTMLAAECFDFKRYIYLLKDRIFFHDDIIDLDQYCV